VNGRVWQASLFFSNQQSLNVRDDDGSHKGVSQDKIELRHRDVLSCEERRVSEVRVVYQPLRKISSDTVHRAGEGSEA